MNKLYIIVLVIFQTFCLTAQNGRSYLDSSIAVNKLNVPKSKTQFYFPTDLFHEIESKWEGKGKNITISFYENPSKIDSFCLKWYSKHLYSMKEPLLFNRPTTKSIYRFTWLRTFNEPMIVRIEKDTSGVVLYWKKTDGKGGYEPGEIIINDKKQISDLDWEQFLSLISISKFWTLKRGGSIGEDGSEWILEGVESTRYHVVTMWSPDSGPFYETCKYLLKLTGVQLGEIY